MLPSRTRRTNRTRAANSSGGVGRERVADADNGEQDGEDGDHREGQQAGLVVVPLTVDEAHVQRGNEPAETAGGPDHAGDRAHLVRWCEHRDQREHRA